MNNRIKRILTVAIVLAMCISVLAIQAFAEEAQVAEIQSRIDAVLTQYGITADMTDNEIAAAISAKDGDTIKATMEEIAAIEEAAQSLTEEELSAVDGELYGRFCDVMDRLYNPVPVTTVNVLDGQVSITDTKNSNSVSSGTVTIQAKGSLFSKTTNNITIKNETANKATLSFDYSASTYSSFTIAGASAAASGAYTVTLDAGASITVVLTSNSGLSNTTATLTLSNFGLTTVITGAKATITYDSTKGSVTDGNSTAIANGGTVTAQDGKASVVATPASGYSFLAWVNADTHERLSAKATETELPVPNDVNIEAVFIKNDGTDVAWFLVDNKYLFNNLNTAAASGTTVVLAANGTLPALTDDPDTAIDESAYTIPSGVTLLIPYDDAGTMDDQASNSRSYKMTEFRRLTLLDGTSITVNGTLQIGAAQGTYSNNFMGHPAGNYGCLEMKSGSTITVNGTLKVRGLLIGDEKNADPETGTAPIVVNSGATVVQLVQICDFRGGTKALEWADGAAFIINQLYIQNIQVGTKYTAGSKLLGQYYVYASTDFKGTVTMIGTDVDSMFNLTSGYIYMSYDAADSKTIIDIVGNMGMNHIAMEIGYSVITKTIDTAKTQLPLFGGWDVNIKSGSVVDINYAAKLLPGCVVTVDYNATLNINNKVYLYDAKDYDQTSSGYSFRDYRYYANTSSATGIYTAMTDTTVDGTLIVNGTLNINGDKGALYTSTSAGADGTYPLYSTTNTGKIVVNNTTNESTTLTEYQANSSTTTVTFNPAQGLLAPNNALGSIAGAAANTTFNHYVGHGWYAGTHTITHHEAQAPTCTNVGWSDYDSCTCGYTTYVEIPTLGHSFTKDPMVCDICGCFKFYANVVLGNNLDMMFAFPKSMLTDWTGCYAEIVRASANGEKDGTTTEEAANWGEVTINGAECYTVTYSGFAAKEMCDTITLTVYDAAKNPISISWTDSIQAYALRMLEKATDETSPNEKLQTVIVDMLNYGAACQTHFTYNTGNLANATLDDTQKGYATKDDPVVNDISPGDSTYWIGSNLVTKSNIQFTLAFNGLSEGSSVTYTFTGHKGNKVTKTVAYADIVAADNCIMIPELVVADARREITVTVKTNVTEESWTESIEAYVARKAEDDENGVFMAFMKFADSAHAYLHSKGA